MYLCIDTITSFAGITLADADRAFHIPLETKNASEGIIDAIDQVLKKAAINLPDLKGILVIQGPGSFTGLRVGLTVANQFAHQLKLPILGLKTNEWWSYRSNDKKTLYLQTMNKAEIYLAEAGQASLKDAQSLEIPGPAVWMGEISEDHRSWLPSAFEEQKELLPVELTWQKVIEERTNPEEIRKNYDLVEAFYGKEPNITKSKKQISVGK